MTSRAPPPRFEACAFDSVRYEAGDASRDTAPCRRRSCGIAALDETTGRPLRAVVPWTTPVEAVPGLFHPSRFLRRASRGDDAGKLRVEDEHGVLYVADLGARAFRITAPPRKPARLRRPPE